MNVPLPCKKGGVLLNKNVVLEGRSYNRSKDGQEDN